MTKPWVGAARKLEDIDIPRIGHAIGVGEDELHAVMDVEARGSGFDGQGRVAMLFEPHVFWRELPENLREHAQERGLACPKWGGLRYPKDSYPRFERALAMHERAAYRSASWGLGQIMGFNASAAGFDTPRLMVEAFAADEEHHLEAMVRFIVSAGLDDELRKHDWAGFARGYNGPGYKKNNYHTKLEARFEWWKGKPDTVWSLNMLGQAA